jgi:hypothetical protein
VKLKSTDPGVKPALRFNYLSTDQTGASGARRSASRG